MICSVCKQPFKDQSTSDPRITEEALIVVMQDGCEVHAECLTAQEASQV